MTRKGKRAKKFPFTGLPRYVLKLDKSHVAGLFLWVTSQADTIERVSRRLHGRYPPKTVDQVLHSLLNDTAWVPCWLFTLAMREAFNEIDVVLVEHVNAGRVPVEVAPSPIHASSRLVAIRREIFSFNDRVSHYANSKFAAIAVDDMLEHILEIADGGPHG